MKEKPKVVFQGELQCKSLQQGFQWHMLLPASLINQVRHRFHHNLTQSSVQPVNMSINHVALACNVWSFPQRLFSVFFLKSLIICPMQSKSKPAQLHCCECYPPTILLQGGVFGIAETHYSLKDNGLAH